LAIFVAGGIGIYAFRSQIAQTFTGGGGGGPVVVKTAPATRGTLERTIRLSGSTVAERYVSLIAPQLRGGRGGGGMQVNTGWRPGWRHGYHNLGRRRRRWRRQFVQFYERLHCQQRHFRSLIGIERRLGEWLDFHYCDKWWLIHARRFRRIPLLQHIPVRGWGWIDQQFDISCVFFDGLRGSLRRCGRRVDGRDEWWRQRLHAGPPESRRAGLNGEEG
jgi:hypothetical protein